MAALAAPRPLLLGNSDADDIFPVPGYRRIADKVSKVYELYGAEEKFELLETKGPHKDTPELRIGINKWMNRWLKGDTTTKVEDDLPPKLTPQQLKVLDKTPANAINPQVPDVLYTPVTIDIPANAEEAKKWWPKKREELLKELTASSFRGWPEKPEAVELSPTGSIDATLSGASSEYQLSSEPGIRVELTTHISTAKKQAIRLQIYDQSPDTADLRGDSHVARIKPRGLTPHSGVAGETQVRRRFPLIGETWESGQVWDVRRAIQAIDTIDEFKKLPIELRGEGPMAIVALYAALYEPSVTKLTLVNPPASFRDRGQSGVPGGGENPRPPARGGDGCGHENRTLDRNRRGRPPEVGVGGPTATSDRREVADHRPREGEMTRR